MESRRDVLERQLAQADILVGAEESGAWMILKEQILNIKNEAVNYFHSTSIDDISNEKAFRQFIAQRTKVKTCDEILNIFSNAKIRKSLIEGELARIDKFRNKK